MPLTIVTDHKWKQFRYRYEVPAKVLADQFDYQNEEEAFDGFFRYRGVWYHLDQFVTTHPNPWGGNSELLSLGFDGFASDSFFSGVAIKVSTDGEEYQVATLIS